MDTIAQQKRKLYLTLNTYLQAAVMNDTDYAPFAETVRATYNGSVVSVGHNEIWTECVRFQSRQSFVDPVTKTAVFFGTTTNEATMLVGKCESPKKDSLEKHRLTVSEYNRSTVKWWFYVVRLKVEDGKITQVEEFTIPEHLIHFDCDPKSLPLHNPIYDAVIPESERSSRQEMISIADKYWECIEKAIPWDAADIHPDCQRMEMGVLCTNSKRNYHTVQSCFWGKSFHWRIENRRWVAVDQERGIVVCFATFQQMHDNTPPGFIAAEVFKIECSVIRDVFAFFKPMQTVSGWESNPND